MIFGNNAKLNTSSKKILVSYHGGYFKRELYSQMGEITMCFTSAILIVFSMNSPTFVQENNLKTSNKIRNDKYFN